MRRVFFSVVTQIATHFVTHKMCIVERKMLEVSPHKYLIQRRQTFYYRRRIPALLKHLFGRIEFNVSLKTADLNDAKKICSRYDRYFDDLITNEIIRTMSSHRPKNAVDFTVKRTVKPDGTVTEEITVTPEDTKACIESGLTPEQSLTYFRELAKLNQELHQSNTTSNQILHTSQNVPALVSAIPTKTNDHHLSKMIDLYYEDLKLVKHGENWKPTAKHITSFRRLIEIVGDKPVSNITRDDAKMVMKKLKELPANTAKYRGMTVDEIIAANTDPEKFSEKTINDQLELYSRLFKWIKTEFKDLPDDPFDNIRVQANSKQRNNQRRFSFIKEDLVKIFSTSLYTSGDYDQPYKFWTPLIALYSGARNAEIAALYKNDVRQVEGTWILDFNENSVDKRLKSKNSFRKTPIHPHLIELGFLDFVDSCNNNGRLFEELSNWTEREGYSRPIGDWFNRDYLQHLGIYIKRKKVFYSFRHTLTSTLERAGVSNPMIEQICGRDADDKSIGQEYYTDDTESSRLLSELSKVDFRQELQNVVWIQNSTR